MPLKKYCFMKICKNNSLIFPKKLFFTVPNGNKAEWCVAAGLKNVPNRPLHICEDHLNVDLIFNDGIFVFCPENQHFELEEDLENYMYWRMAHVNARLKPRVPVFREVTKVLLQNSSPQPRETDESTTGSNTVICGPEASPKQTHVTSMAAEQSTNSSIKIHEQENESTQSRSSSMEISQTGVSVPSLILSEIELEQCRCCGDIVQESIDVTSVARPYIHRNKAVLALNGLSAELDFNSHVLPNIVCLDCDDKLQEIYKFVKRVKIGQDAFIDEFTVDEPNDNEMLIDKLKDEINDDESTFGVDEIFEESKDSIENEIKAENDPLELDNTDNFDDDNDNSIAAVNTFTHKRKSGEVENKTNEMNEIKGLLIHESIGDVNEAEMNEVHKPSRYEIVRVKKRKKSNIYMDVIDGQIKLMDDIKEEGTELDNETNINALVPGCSKLNET